MIFSPEIFLSLTFGNQPAKNSKGFDLPTCCPNSHLALTLPCAPYAWHLSVAINRVALIEGCLGVAEQDNNANKWQDPASGSEHPSSIYDDSHRQPRLLGNQGQKTKFLLHETNVALMTTVVICDQQTDPFHLPLSKFQGPTVQEECDKNNLSRCSDFRASFCRAQPSAKEPARRIERIARARYQEADDETNE